MRPRTLILLVCGAAALGLAVRDAGAFRGFGGWHGGGWSAGGMGGYHGGGWHANDFGGVSHYHSGGFGDGFGSVHYSGFSHYGPETGFVHYGGATHEGMYGTQHYGGWGGYHDGNVWGGYGAASTWHPYGYGSIGHYDAAAYHTPGYYGAWGYGAGVYHGPLGTTVAGYRGPYSAGAIATLPGGYTAVAWHGDTFYHANYAWYHPYWYGGTVAYFPVYPPVGFFYATLPVAAVPTVINSTTYYVNDGVYYQPATQGGQTGYTVIEPPAGAGGMQDLGSASGFGPDPMTVLSRMSNYMGGQNHVRMHIDETFDEVTTAGQKVQMHTTRKIWLDRPNKFAIDVTGSGVSRRIAFDGSNFIIVDRLRNVYASLPMSPPSDSVLDQMAKQYGMAEPADDLMYTSIEGHLQQSILSAQTLGDDWAAGELCDHLAFTGRFGVNWEMWVSKGDKPVARKLVITYNSAPGRPQYALVVAKWDTPLVFWDADFSANPPSGASSANMLQMTGMAAPNQAQGQSQ